MVKVASHQNNEQCTGTPNEMIERVGMQWEMTKERNAPCGQSLSIENGITVCEVGSYKLETT